MARFSEIEKMFLEKVDDDRLCTSLAIIRESVEDIWGEPPILRYFTPHGMSHIERVADYASKLINSNRGKDFTSIEIYLLLAGIYLHDIGMQCDIANHPDIKKAAKRLGAKFNIRFRRKNFQEYNKKEQFELRRNHSYISAAWIKCARANIANILYCAARTVPKDISDDLMDICIYHSNVLNLSMNNNLKLSNGRKKLIASILRLSDELDADWHRVNIEIVEDRSIPLENKIHFYRHNLISITSNDIGFRFIIHPHPEDYDFCGERLLRQIWCSFQEKNDPIINILRSENIAVLISPEIVQNSSTNRLPTDIREKLIEDWIRGL